MLIPYSTDAPIYHWPFATLGTIILNLFIFFAVAVLPEELQETVYGYFILNYGYWNPLQWVTSNYLHGDILHVLGNMIVLWGIGIVVEGKVGWWRFLAIYNLIGVVQCGVEQTLMLGASEGGSLGASSIIYGLIAIALVWAPKNELSCILMVRGASTVDLPISTYAMFSIGIQVLLGVTSAMAMAADGHGFIGMTSQILHVMGAAVGFVIGAFMVKKKWVDCENWDLFSVMQGRHTMTRDQLAEESLNSSEGKAQLASLATAMQGKLAEFIAASEGKAALAVHRRGQKQFGKDWRLSEEQKVQLITLLRKTQDWDDAVQMMVEYLKTTQPREGMVRAALAQVLIEKMNRPGQGLKVLSLIDVSALPPKQQAACTQLKKRAEQLAEDNPYEVTADW